MSELPLPGTSSVTTPLALPSSCDECHGSFDAGSALKTWTGSAMGHSARDPLFLSALTEAEKDAPGYGDFCMRCHAPEAWLQGACVETDGRLLTSDDSGVTCSVCHRMDPSPWQRNGQYTVANDLEYRGPYSDAVAPHRNQQSAWISDSRLCGSCHDLRNPLVERRALDGTGMNMPFPEQTTYFEWASSAYALAGGPDHQTCQDCHMPESSARVAELGPVRPDRSSHALAGGNKFLLASIAFLEPGLGLASELSAGQGRIEAMLRSAVLLEEISPPAVLTRGEVFALTFRVTNLAGHKLPTGYPEGRRVYLSVRSTELGLDLGAFDEASGEPMRSPAVYHAKHGRFGVGPGHRLALNDAIFADTRIPAKGMVSSSTIAPVGKIYAETSPGVLAHWDDVTVTATAPCDLQMARVQVTAALWYQSVTKTYVDALVQENGAHPRGATLRLAFDEADPGPYQMAQVLVTIDLDSASTCAPPDAGVRDADPPDATRMDAGMNDSGRPVQVDEDGGCSCAMTARAENRGGADGDPLFSLVAVFVGIWGLYVGRMRSR